ncbi:MAG: hypothetical protein UW92_C0025G0003 [Candidatus Jorgensenbacteria bacterium GW2011_GWA2_45_13]|uniref:Uncharacterized protein n=1 Tax=Candidatus Jorgensenbacteria bacterium GW2011_GWA2_45_13 TaxID=1618662 RepID=A0A0G1L4B9_9BACT|nr:MAG: hypothetical protein UW92_C0025G0003 [Candidatus Jorgensenbacteria bacterium GW2011_GWA2_45_13]
MKLNIKGQLKKLQAIRPDEGFVLRTRQAILLEKPRMSWGYILKTHEIASAGVFVFAAATLFLLASSGTTTFTGGKPVLSSLQNTNGLQQELSDMNISIQLNEISFQTDADKAITAAITEIADTKTSHLNPEMLKFEQNTTVPESGSNPKIDELLKTILL